MRLYRKIDTNGFFIEDVLLDAIPYLTKTITETITEQQVTIEYDTVVVDTVTETVTLEDGTIQDVTYDITEQVPREVTTEVQNEVSHEEVVMQDVLNEDGEVIGQEPVVNPYYIETECPQGFYKPKWDGAQWVEGGTKPLESVESQITRLKLELEETDYQIIKCSEYQLLGLELPYDLQALHTNRQVIRDKINKLETV